MGSFEWYEVVEKRGEELGELLYERLKDKMGSKIRPSPASDDPPKGSPEWYAAVEARSDERGEMLYEMVKGQLVSKKPTKVTGRDRERIVDELEATLDAVRAEMELLGPLVRSSRSAARARLFLALDRRSRETGEVLVAMRDAESATQH